MIDSHSHLYDSAFDADRAEVVARAIGAGVTHIMLPAVDSGSHAALFDTAMEFPGTCLPMMGLHPTSVNGNADFRRELEAVKDYIEHPPCRIYAVGEVGLDLYWDKDYIAQQTEALLFQTELALKYDLPLVVHCRDAWPELIRVLSPFSGSGLRGVLHAFSGGYEEYDAIRNIGDFMIGIGGPVTYKKSGLPDLLPRIPLEHIVLETDAPYLPPVPYRGKRNESGYIPLICARVAEILGLPTDEAARRTTINAERMFGLDRQG